MNDSSINSNAVYTAAHTNVAVFDLSDRTQIEITGSDRARFLHSFTSNDIKRLRPGQGCETFITNLKGKAVGHVFVFCGSDSHWLDGTAGQQEAIVDHLKKYVLIDDVQLIPRKNERGELFVTGPLASQLLQVDAAMPIGGHELRDTTGVCIDIRRVDLIGQPGFLMSIPRDQVQAVKRGLAAVGIVEGSSDQFESLRIEAGFPMFGVDFDDDNLAQEVARTKQSISFDKGCYLGQETIARLDALGHTNREIRRLTIEGNNIPPKGTEVFDAAGTGEVGIITSAARIMKDSGSQTPDLVVALGMLKRAACPPGTVVRVNSANAKVEGAF